MNRRASIRRRRGWISSILSRFGELKAEKALDDLRGFFRRGWILRIGQRNGEIQGLSALPRDKAARLRSRRRAFVDERKLRNGLEEGAFLFAGLTVTLY
jgi:hypothetical protein